MLPCNTMCGLCRCVASILRIHQSSSPPGVSLHTSRTGPWQLFRVCEKFWVMPEAQFTAWSRCCFALQLCAVASAQEEAVQSALRQGTEEAPRKHRGKLGSTAAFARSHAEPPLRQYLAMLTCPTAGVLHVHIYSKKATLHNRKARH